MCAPPTPSESTLRREPSRCLGSLPPPAFGGLCRPEAGVPSRPRASSRAVGAVSRPCGPGAGLPRRCRSEDRVAFPGGCAGGDGGVTMPGRRPLGFELAIPSQQVARLQARLPGRRGGRICLHVPDRPQPQLRLGDRNASRATARKYEPGSRAPGKRTLLHLHLCATAPGAGDRHEEPLAAVRASDRPALFGVEVVALTSCFALV